LRVEIYPLATRLPHLDYFRQAKTKKRGLLMRVTSPLDEGSSPIGGANFGFISHLESNLGFKPIANFSPKMLIEVADEYLKQKKLTKTNKELSETKKDNANETH
jgi:hypothetical protein